MLAEREGTVFTTDHGSQIYISQFRITSCVDEMLHIATIEWTWCVEIAILLGM